jgi:cytochrome c oxidase subunit I+III
VAETGWGNLNMLATAGVLVLTLGVLVTFLNVLYSLKKGPIAADDPWQADTLEWATASPPPNYNFEYIPVVRGRWGLWDMVKQGERPFVTGLRNDRREVLNTTVLDAEPQTISIVPGPSLWPLFTAVAVSVAFIGFIFSPWFVPIGFVLTFIGIVGWHWPREQERRPPWKKEKGASA